MERGIIFQIEIEMGNDGMQTNGDVAKALHAVADKLETGHHLFSGSSIRDPNGNTVGRFQYVSVMEKKGEK